MICRQARPRKPVRVVVSTSIYKVFEQIARQYQLGAKKILVSQKRSNFDGKGKSTWVQKITYYRNRHKKGE